MRPYLVSFDRAARLWRIRGRASGAEATARRVILDAQARSEGGGLIVTGELQVKDQGVVHIDDHKPPPGTPKPSEMREWCAVFDEATGHWAVYRHGMEGVLVMALALELDCHGITSEGVFHFLAEMLVSGRTNREQSFAQADTVKLRTLCVYDQTVDVKAIAIRPLAKAPG